MDRVLDVQQVAKSFGGFSALKGVSLTIPRSCIFSLLGPNGAGKTTLIKCILGMMQPDRGAIRLGKLDAFADSVAAKRLVGYLPDEPIFYDFLTGQDILQFVGELHGLGQPVWRDRSARLAERLELTNALGEYAENYSRGMKKKLGLICALLHEPQLLILDEPTNGLDPHGTHVLHELMREQRAAGKSVLFSTHLLDQAERLADQVAVMKQGEIAAAGSLDALRRQCGTHGDLEQLFFQLTGPSPLADSDAASCSLQHA